MKLVPLVKERFDPGCYTSQRDMDIYLGRYAFADRYIAGKLVLDIACGTGYGSNFLLKKGATRVTCADISVETINYARARYGKEGLSFVTADAQRMPFPDESFDVVVSMETIEHLPDYQAFLSECYRVLRAGGTLVCSTPNKAVSSPGSEKPKAYHIKEFYISEFRQLLEPYFHNIFLYGYLRYKKKGIKEKLLNVPVTALRSFPAVLQVAVLKVVALITRLIFRGYHPVKLEDIDEEDFERLISNECRPFPLEEAVPEYIMAVGQKAAEVKG